MDILISVAAEFWNTIVPTTWFMVLGLLISFSFLKKILF